MLNNLQPHWPAPPVIQAFTTIRPFNARTWPTPSPIKTPSPPYWLNQTHSDKVVNVETRFIASHSSKQSPPETADASFAFEPNVVCAVLTADCLPLLLCEKNGKAVAAIHAGWKGLAKGIIENTIKAMNLPSETLLAWLGPAIGPTAFEVGDEVRECFVQQDQKAALAFEPHHDRWLANIYCLATQRLQNMGIHHIYGGDFCTVTDSTRFFSYRREGVHTGRMASLIWIESKHTL